MFDPSDADARLLDPARVVVEAALEAAPGLAPSELMLVGARCRDVLHDALGHTFATTATLDVDLALALTSWDVYRALASAFPKASSSGITYRINGLAVDLLPFGEVEDPDGIVEPPPRGETMSVWAFEEIFAASRPVTLSDDATIQIPTPAGYAAAKLGAWLDRSEYGEVKDAPDIALATYWYAESSEVEERLYATPAGEDLLVQYAADVQRAAAHLLGADIAATIGETRLNELLDRWPGNLELLGREFTTRHAPSGSAGPKRRHEVIDALTRGLHGTADLSAPER